jgi:CRP/FNR family transcriptional regulator, cyclic AMP receptor protein
MTLSFEEIARRVELFKGISPDDISKIFSKGMTIRVLKGEVIFYQGTIGNQMYVVLGGTVGVYDGKKRIAVLQMGDMFGEMALVNNEPRSGTVIAEEDAHLFVLSETTFQRLMTKTVSIRILLNIVHTISHRLRDANALLARLGEKQ